MRQLAEYALKALTITNRRFSTLRGSDLLRRWLGLRIKSSVVRTTLRGFRMSLDLRDNLQWYIFVLGYWEEAEIRVLEKILRPGDVFYDVGAHVGYHSMVGSQIVGAGGRVVSFEPIRRNREVFLKNISLNKMSNVTLVEHGLSDQEQEMRISLPAFQYGKSSIRQAEGYNDEESIVLKAADCLIKDLDLPMPNVIKIDVEGAEYKVLKGMAGILTSLKEAALLIEITPFFLEKLGASESALRSLLHSCGFQKNFIISRIECSENGISFYQTNEIFLKGR